jgi:hypothetical protein
MRDRERNNKGPILEDSVLLTKDSTITYGFAKPRCRLSAFPTADEEKPGHAINRLLGHNLRIFRRARGMGESSGSDA